MKKMSDLGAIITILVAAGLTVLCWHVTKRTEIFYFMIPMIFVAGMRRFAR